MCEWLAIDVMSCSLADQMRLYQRLLNDKAYGENAQKFFAWGSPDLVVISRLRGAKEAKRVYHRRADTGIFDRQVYFGHVIRGTALPLHEISNKLPLVGISFIKLKERIIHAVPPDRMGIGAYEWLGDEVETTILPKVKEAFPHFSRDDFEYILCAATGWADALLVIFSNSYSPMQLILSHLRAMTVSTVFDHYGITDIPKDESAPFHALLTTCTIPGTHFDFSGEHLGNLDGMVQKFQSKLASWDSFVCPSVSVHAKPGHLNNALSFFDSIGAKNGILPTFGRTDFIVTPQIGQTTLSQYFDFFIKEVLQKTQNRTGSIGWTETRLAFLGPMFYAEPGPAPIDRSVAEDAPDTMSWTLSLWDDEFLLETLPGHTAGALRQLGISLEALVQHEATSEFYQSLADCYLTVYENTRITVEKAKEGKNSDILSCLVAPLGQFCEGLDLCFKDRYRGSYPVGSMSAVPALTSQASFHMALSVIDDLANTTLDVIHAILWQQLSNKPANARKRTFAACCHLGNASIPEVNVLEYLGVGFLNVPTDLMFAPEGIAYILHETGHIFWNSALPTDSEKILKEALPEIKLLVDEVLCDFLSLCAVFRGDSSRMCKEITTVLKDILPAPRYAKRQIEMRFRIECAKILEKAISRGGSVAKSLQKSIDLLSRKAKSEEQQAGNEALKDVLTVFLEMIKADPVFVKMLQAIHMLITPANIAEPSHGKHKPLQSVQDYFSSPICDRDPEGFMYKLHQADI